MCSDKTKQKEKNRGSNQNTLNYLFFLFLFCFLFFVSFNYNHMNQLDFGCDCTHRHTQIGKHNYTALYEVKDEKRCKQEQYTQRRRRRMGETIHQLCCIHLSFPIRCEYVQMCVLALRTKEKKTRAKYMRESFFEVIQCFVVFVRYRIIILLIALLITFC